MSEILGTIIFQNSVSLPNEGKSLNMNRATQCTFSIEGTATSIEVQFEAQSHKNGLFLPCYCYTLDSEPIVATQVTTLNDSLWRVDLGSIYSFRTRIVNISGGYVNIIGTVGQV
jgi:hypothetical protein